MIELCRKGNLSLTEALIQIEHKGLEPPITEEMDKHTSKTRDEILESVE